MTRWAILTGEYPPQSGGVSDYTRLVARGLADAGDSIRVYAPPLSEGAEVDDTGISVRRLPGRFGTRSLARLDHWLAADKPDRILVQYVPHAFGWKAMNLPFAIWLATRARRIAPVSVMFHEVAFPFSWRPLRHALLGGVTRLMAQLVGGAAERVFVSIPAWGDVLKRYCPRMVYAEWAPVPCTFDVNPHPDAGAEVRRQFGPVIGHFGTFGAVIAPMLDPALVEFLNRVPGFAVLLMGRGSREFLERFELRHPEWIGRMISTGALPANRVSEYLRACELLIQPFPDGISSRRTSAMAGLANGLPVVTNLGQLSEPLWVNGAVAAAATPDPVAIGLLAARLLGDPAARAELGRRAGELYRDTFAIEHTIAKLRGER